MEEIFKIIHRRDSVANTLPNKENWFRRVFGGFTSWTEIRNKMDCANLTIIKKDTVIEKNCVDDILKIIDNITYRNVDKKKFDNQIKKELQELSLAAKNRAEYLSDRGDFFPVGITINTAFFAILSLIIFKAQNYQNVSWAIPGFAYFVGGSIVVLVALISIWYSILRIKTRQQVGDLKVYANIFDAVEKRILSPSK